MAMSLRSYAHEEDDEEIEEDEGEPAVAGVCCAQCEEEIRMSEEVFLLRIVQPYLIDGELQHIEVMDAAGMPSYEPLLWEFECWEEEQESLQTLREDAPPVPAQHGLLECDICRSDIEQGELVGLIQFGEMQWSPRTPNHQHTTCFAALDEGKHICIACLSNLDNGRTTPFWPNEIEPVPGVQVCIEGIFERCWRHGACTCPRKNTVR